MQHSLQHAPVLDRLPAELDLQVSADGADGAAHCLPLVAAEMSTITMSPDLAGAEATLRSSRPRVGTLTGRNLISRQTWRWQGRSVTADPDRVISNAHMAIVITAVLTLSLWTVNLPPSSW
jgi:hypothetical protein